jgi:putative aldouronate transport system permease protein
MFDKKKGFFYELFQNRVLYLMFVPVALYFFAFAYIPMAGIVVSFKDFNYRDGLFFSPWNGFDNFKYFFMSGKALLVTKNTIVYNLVFITCYTFFSIVVAIFISEMSGKYFKKISQSFMFLPYFISWVVFAAFTYNFFNYDYGVINTLLRKIGQQPLDIYSTPSNWYFLLPIFYVWKWIGFGSVLYLAAISGIDRQCYEAAIIDGASMYQQIWHITLPLLKPTVIILVLLAIGRIMRGEFDMFYNLIGNNGVLMDATDIIDTLVFRSLVGIQDFGMASAAGLYQSVLCFVIIVTVNYIVRKVDKDSALF